MEMESSQDSPGSFGRGDFCKTHYESMGWELTGGLAYMI